MGATYFLVGNFDTYQLIINTPTTIITFLLVALLQNTHKRNEQALQHKLDAVADGLGDLMEHFAEDDPGRPRRIWRATSELPSNLRTTSALRRPPLFRPCTPSSPCCDAEASPGGGYLYYSSRRSAGAKWRSGESF